MLCLDHNFVWCWNLDTSESRSEMLGKFWNVVMEKDGENSLCWSREKWRSIKQSQEAESCTTYSKGRLTGLVTSCAGTAWRKDREDGKTGRKTVLDDLKETRRCGNWKSTHTFALSGELALEGALDLPEERLRNGDEWKLYITAWYNNCEVNAFKLLVSSL
jgi:hypothetical protein